MTEENTPDGVQPDIEDFDINEWTATGATKPKRTAEEITVYRDTSLVDEARKLTAEINRLNAKNPTQEPDPDAAIGDEDEASELERRQDELLEKIQKTKATVRIEALSDGQVEDVAAAFKKRFIGETREWHQTNKGTCMVLAEAATIGGKTITADQWRALSEGPLAGGQWQRIKQAYHVAQTKMPRVDVPFSQSSSGQNGAGKRS